jgi:hypothetical protein
VRSLYAGSGLRLEVTREDVVVETMGHHEIDPEWSFTDAAGHAAPLETADLLVTGTYWCEACRDEHDEVEYRCRLCGATVEPEYVFVGPDRHLVAGLAEAVLRLDDGRVYVLRGDETSIPWTESGPAPEWVERVTAREPDEMNLTLGAA